MASKQWVKKYVGGKEYVTQGQVKDMLLQLGYDVTFFPFTNTAHIMTREHKKPDRIQQLEEYLNVEWTDGHYHKKRGSK